MPARVTGALSDDARETVGPILQAALIDLIDLSLFGKQAHWNVVGPTFRSVHLQLDELVEAARRHSDVIAERAAAIGVPPDGQSSDVAKATHIEPLEHGWQMDNKLVDHVVDRLGAAIHRLRTGMEALEEPDPTSQDLLNDVLADLEQQFWMFQATTVGGPRRTS